MPITKYGRTSISTNANGGLYVRGRGYPIEKMAEVAHMLQTRGKLSHLQPPMTFDQIAAECRVGQFFVRKVYKKIMEGGISDPKYAIKNCVRGPGALSLDDRDVKLLLQLQKEDSHQTMQSYADVLARVNGKKVDRSTISRFFNHGFPIKGSLSKPDLIPIDKFKPENVLKFFEYKEILNAMLEKDGSHSRIKFADEKLLKGCEVYCRRSRRNVLTGEVAPIEVLSDFRNTYSIIGFCGVDRRACPLFWTMNQEKNDSEAFADAVERAIQFGFLREGDFLVLDNAAIHVGGVNTDLPKRLLEEYGIVIVFLPPRAPELNPIELVWACLVKKMKALNMNVLKRIGSHMVPTAACHVMRNFSHDDIARMYRHCKYRV